MKNKLLVSLIAAAFLSGCASSGSESNDAPQVSNPIEAVPENPIAKDDGADMPQQDHYSINANGEVMVNGEIIGAVNELGEVRVDDVAIGRIYTDADGTRYFQAYGSDNKYYGDINRSGVITIDWERTEVDGGWGYEAPENPIMGTPVNPIEGQPSNPIAGTPENPIEASPSNPIEDGTPEPMNSLSAEQKSQLRSNANELRATIKARLNRS
ncbi:MULTISPECIES: hypothetical protein [unclassified Agarivorans]|uniref:hypothetical protein n=1 Tax=unclassified Agarivorans TaxID=2636026 RepID=UPI0026E2EE4A|nr:MULTISPECIES: hypothetical protein [unclassified Agarivorans]MDO6687547.1 hypothetical protein [Agarivorans sp. 3_MG-2023]MDO6717120.1 hypothetical protein [Agarivorans sp. 2_MG-2023]